MTTDQANNPDTKRNAAPRRGFLYRLTAGVAAAAALLGPLGVGIAALFDPVVRRKQSSGNFVRVASLDALPADGKPYRFSIIADRTDAWNYYPPEPVGVVYLRRDNAEATPVAISSICPHVGCGVHWDNGKQVFVCPCHNSDFKVDGEISDPASSPSPRGLDHLVVEVRDGEIWVDFRKFKVGVADKIPA
jgi:Rieske Fe-S protein